MTAACRSRGAVLVTLLGGLLLIGAILFAAVFSVTLETMAARSAARAVAVEAAVQGALHLAAAELATGGPSASTPSALMPSALGPWPAFGVDVRVAVSAVADGALLLVAEPAGGPAVGAATMVIVLEPALAAVWRP